MSVNRNQLLKNSLEKGFFLHILAYLMFNVNVKNIRT
jgi:hypothetical protein